MMASHMPFMRFVASCALVLCTSLGFAGAAHADSPRPVVMYYLGTNGVADVGQVPWQDVTQINIAFAGINPRGMCAWMDMSGNDKVDTTGSVQQAIAALVAARNANNPNVKLVLSVGGWTMSYRFSDTTATPRGALTLASSCVALVDSLGLDGVDYDWEYPGNLGQKNCPNDAAHANCVSSDDGVNFTRLLKYTRQLLDDDSRPLSVAVYANTQGNTQAYDYKGMDKYLSFWNVMSYDVNAPSWVPNTSFNAPISAAKATLAFFQAQGATASKLNLGIPLYGYRYQNVTSAAVGAKPTASASKADNSQYTYNQILATYGADPLCCLTTSSDGDFYYCSTGEHVGDWVGVDTPRVAGIKAAFVRDNGYGGAMFWVIPGDSTDFAVTKAVKAALANP
jgi:chitinase